MCAVPLAVEIVGEIAVYPELMIEYASGFTY